MGATNVVGGKCRGVQYLVATTKGRGEGNVCRRFIRVVLGEVESERNDRPIEKEDFFFAVEMCDSIE